MPVKNEPYTVAYYVEDIESGGGVAGDDGNHTLRLLADGGLVSPSGSISEPDSTNLKGWYTIGLNSDENIGDIMVLGGKTTNSSAAIRGIEWYNAPYEGGTINSMTDDMRRIIREEVERLYGINRFTLYGDGPLIDQEADDNSRNTWPSVFYDSASGVYRNYYTAKDDNGSYIIRHKESVNGKTDWSTGVTVLSSGGIPGEWESDGPWAPVAWKENSMYYLMYTSRDAARTQTAIGLASGVNALALEKCDSNPVMIPTSGTWELNSCEITGLIKTGNLYNMFYCTLAGCEPSEKDFPSYARKVGYASGISLTEWHKQSTPVFGDMDDSYENQPYHGYYSASPFKYSDLYYLVVGKYAPSREDYTQFELWSSYDVNFSSNIRKRVGVIMTTDSFGDYPNEDIDIISFESENGMDITRTYSADEEVRMYFGTAHKPDNGSQSWSMALATEDHIRKALYFVPAIQNEVINKIPSTRWALASSGIAYDVWDEMVYKHTTDGSTGQTIVTTSGILVDSLTIGSGLALTRQLNAWGLILLNHLREVGIEP